jgi:hypothetical protein
MTVKWGGKKLFHRTQLQNSKSIKDSSNSYVPLGYSHVDWLVDATISEKHAVSIFGAEGQY